MRTTAPLLLAALAALLASCGGKSNDPVVLLQQERDAGLRRGAVIALLERGPGAKDLWHRLLTDEDAEIARLTATALAGAADKPGWSEVPAALVDDLLAAAARREPTVRAEAILALGRLRADDPLLPPKISGALVDGDARVRRAALQAFRSFGPATAGMDLAPVRAILAKEPALALDAAMALAACGDSSATVVDTLAAAVESGKDPAASLQAVHALADLGPRASSAAARLAPKLAGAPETLARDLADALGQCGVDDAAVVAALEKAVGRREEAVQVCAALSLLRLGKPAAKGPGILDAGLRSKDALVAVRAAEGLAHIGGNGWDHLRRRVEGGDAEAALALARLAAAGKPLPAEARTALETAAKDAPLDLRRAATRALAAGKSR